MEQESPEFARLRKVIEAFEWGSIQRIACEDGKPTGVDVLIHFNLRENVAARLRKLALDTDH